MRIVSLLQYMSHPNVRVGVFLFLTSTFVNVPQYVSGATQSDNDPLQMVIKTGIQNSFAVQQNKLTLETSENNRLIAYGALLPTLTLSAGRNIQQTQGLNSDAVTTSYTKSDAATMSLQANWTIWNTYQNIRNVQLGEKDKQYTVQATRTQIQTYVVGLISAYLQYEYLLSTREAQLNQVAQSKITNDESQLLVKAGAKTKLDAMDAEIQLASDEESLKDLENNIAANERNLRALMSVEKLESLPHIDLLKFKPFYTPVFEDKIKEIAQDWQSEIESKQPDLQVTKLSLEKSLLTLKQTKLGYFPTTTIALTQNYTLDSYVNNTPYGGVQPLQQGAVSLNFSWQFWDFLQTPRTIDNAQKAYDSTILAFRQQRLEQHAKFANSLDQINVLKKTIEISRLIVEKAEKQQEYSREMYRLGRITLLQMQQANSRLVAARTDLANRLQNYYTNAAQILYNMGYDLTPPGINLAWVK